MIREVFGNLLRDSGYSIDYAEDGVIGLDKIKKNNYDLIILGIMMPNMTGIDVLEHLSEEKIPHGKIIIFTNLNTPEIKQQTYSLGVSDFWVKAQMTPVMLLEKINNLTL
jgi:CheY-like chemotaxis protein